MLVKNDVRCNWCDWEGYEDDLDLIVDLSDDGISLDTLTTRLKAGESLATIAGDKKDALIAAMIAEINKQIDAALAAGKITTTQASAQKAKKRCLIARPGWHRRLPKPPPRSPTESWTPSCVCPKRLNTVTLKPAHTCCAWRTTPG